MWNIFETGIETFWVLVSIIKQSASIAALGIMINFISKVPELFLRVFNVLISCLIIAPLVVIYWASTWKLCDIYIVPSDPALSSTISLVVGFSVQFFFMFHQDSIAELLTCKNNKCLNIVLMKVYALVSALTCVNFWRGVWGFVDKVSTDEIAMLIMNITQNLLILLISRTLRNSVVPPFVVAMDQIENCFKLPTYFKLKVNILIVTFYKIEA